MHFSSGADIVNAGEDIDILAKNKRFVRRFGSAKTCRIDKCGHFMGPALARLLGGLLHVSGSIDDLQVRDAQKASSEATVCRDSRARP